ncbi:CENP-X/MHF2 family protein [Aspergillus candidus]|uniref:CENP-S associating centromere protein X-domain-containing protein n=1 Tax=Aspergillus candidus TaxID=41067 RepID=A0A2I2EYH6_ASPCN|nr:CENP-S associating centromere protein X-domain-containing protein [Aspergillus candidus]PLB33431.1 CENP-S associating centromere protein X-domain-containing protein [Aspergillus candidus]
MPPERQPPQKRRRLPFNPPSRASPSASAGPSTSTSKAKPKTKPSKPTDPTTSKETTAAPASSSSSKPKAKRSQPAQPKEKTQSQKQKDKRPARTESPPPSASGSASGSEAGSSSNGSISSREPSPEPDYILAEITDAQPEADDVLSSEPAIPTKLLTRLLHQHFQNPKTKVAKEANSVIAKYVDVFVREALARAAYERAEGGGGDGFLEVEDLEKMAPQLTMDF